MEVPYFSVFPSMSSLRLIVSLAEARGLLATNLLDATGVTKIWLPDTLLPEAGVVLAVDVEAIMVLGE